MIDWVISRKLRAEVPLVRFRLYQSTNRHRFRNLLRDAAELPVTTFCSCQFSWRNITSRGHYCRRGVMVWTGAPPPAGTEVRNVLLWTREFRQRRGNFSSSSRHQQVQWCMQSVVIAKSFWDSTAQSKPTAAWDWTAFHLLFVSFNDDCSSPLYIAQWQTDESGSESLLHGSKQFSERDSP